MLILHYAPDNASLILRLALDEAGMPYRSALVDRRQHGQTRPDYKRLNPVGRIPALETPQGPIFETAACLLWIAETSGHLAPAPQDAGRPGFLKWLFFLSNTLHAEMRMLFYPEKYAPGAEQTLRDQVAQNIDGHLALLAQAVTACDGFSAAEAKTPLITDLYLAVLLRWPALYPRGGTAWYRLTTYPSLAALAARIETRPSMARAMIAEGLGPTPLTAPHYPSPPEGSAL
ncbi:MAG TPA: glutathione S-transferase [Rhodobacteraceae bacterium]|jgi:glutathione S-transferase|nr:glutathione S-transferase [Paracoccaceae bacterium]HBV54975.1 glutathione S-transferase [Paracoccaceae bacterium]